MKVFVIKITKIAMFASFDNHHNQNTIFLTLLNISWLFWDNNGFDYNTLRGINPKFSMSQTSDPSATKVQPKTFSMTQLYRTQKSARPTTQVPSSLLYSRNLKAWKYLTRSEDLCFLFKRNNERRLRVHLRIAYRHRYFFQMSENH